jgi:hypothetical protein
MFRFASTRGHRDAVKLGVAVAADAAGRLH